MKVRLKARTKVYLTARQIRELKRRAAIQGFTFEEQLNEAVRWGLELQELDDFLRHDFPRWLRRHAPRPLLKGSYITGG